MLGFRPINVRVKQSMGGLVSLAELVGLLGPLAPQPLKLQSLATVTYCTFLETSNYSYIGIWILDMVGRLGYFMSP